MVSKAYALRSNVTRIQQLYGLKPQIKWATPYCSTLLYCTVLYCTVQYCTVHSLTFPQIPCVRLCENLMVPRTSVSILNEILVKL